MRFTWKGLLLSPLATPLVVSFACISPGQKHQVFAFFLLLILGAVVSYSSTLFLFLPGLYALSKLTTLRLYKVCLLGTLLGIFAFFPVAWQVYMSSGPDSGPPTGTFFGFLARSWAEGTTWVFPAGGLVTSLAYWVLSNKPDANRSEAIAA